MTDLRTRIARGLYDEFSTELLGDYSFGWDRESDYTKTRYLNAADAVIRELTDAIPPIVATAIQGYVQAEWAAISHHGAAGEYELLKRLDREALQIARYATTHKDWNG